MSCATSFALGTPYFSTESLDAWILRYWPYHEWEEIYKVYVGAADYPHPRWVVGGKFGYENLVDAMPSTSGGSGSEG